MPSYLNAIVEWQNDVFENTEQRKEDKRMFIKNWKKS